MKYMILFGAMFIVSLIGKICYTGNFNIIEGTIEKVVSNGGGSSNAITDIDTNIELSAGTSSGISSADVPPF